MSSHCSGQWSAHSTVPHSYRPCTGGRGGQECSTCCHPPLTVWWRLLHRRRASVSTGRRSKGKLWMRTTKRANFQPGLAALPAKCLLHIQHWVGTFCSTCRGSERWLPALHQSHSGKNQPCTRGRWCFQFRCSADVGRGCKSLDQRCRNTYQLHTVCTLWNQQQRMCLACRHRMPTYS